uniref:Uncharacterized protein n=1 Tax=viral metagenome TaxID=1070528 RepID=A0A2V0RC37_9ZZZZ
MSSNNKRSFPEDPPEVPNAGTSGDSHTDSTKRAKPDPSPDESTTAPSPASTTRSSSNDTRPVVHTSNTSRNEEDGLTSLSIQMASMPRMKRHNTLLNVELNCIDIFSCRYYDYALRFLDPYEAMRIAITKENFIKCIKYLLNCRLHDVAGKATGHRYPGRTVAGSVYQIPTPLALLISDVGAFQSPSMGTTFIPVPPRPPIDKSQEIGQQVGHALLASFAQFVGQLNDHGLCTTCPISRDVSGTSFWLSQVTTPSELPSDEDSDRILVSTSVLETTPRDFMQQALSSFTRTDRTPTMLKTFESCVISDPQAICLTYFTNR